MELKYYNVRDKIPIGKALVYENLKEGDWVIDIGERDVKKRKGIELISNTIIRIPKSINKKEQKTGNFLTSSSSGKSQTKEEYWQKVNRIKDFQRIKNTLHQYKVSPIFEVQEYSFLGKKVISRFCEEDINYLKEILN